MAFYRIEWKHSALKELKKLPKETVQGIIQAVAGLSNDPFPMGVRKLAGSERAYRL